MLTLEGSRVRMDRFRTRLREMELDAALIADRREIYYLTGLLLCDYPNFPFPAVLFVETDGRAWIAAHTDEGDAGVDDRVTYPPNVLYTMNPDPMRLLCEAVGKHLSGARSKDRIGYQAEHTPKAISDVVDDALSPSEWVPIDDAIADLQRVKDPDELECLRMAAKAGLAAYTAVQKVIEPGVNELEVLSAGQLAAREAVGENIFHGGDYQCAQLGGWARDRTTQAGELYIIDAHTAYHGYWSDLCRTWSVDARPTDIQQRVFDTIKAILESIPDFVKPGTRGTEVFAMIDERIREVPGFEDTGLIHHAGHAVGIRPHEMPDLNRDREGILEVGTVFSCEPGAYSDALNCGIRLENTFYIGEEGIENLSAYPLELLPRR